MARGPKKHLKRLNAPKHWMLSKLGGIYAPRPSQGPHKLRECIPITLLLRDRLKFALTRREVMMITMRRHIQVDGKIRTDVNFPCGLMDVISLPQTKQHFRLVLNEKGKFALVTLDDEKEAQHKLCRVQKIAKGAKQYASKNMFKTGNDQAVPYLVTHDGRTIRYPDPAIRVNDVVKVDLTNGKIVDFTKFEAGVTCLVTKGNNIGRIGVVTRREKHPGSFEIIHLKDKVGNEFATRVSNVFTLDEKIQSLFKGNGVKKSITAVRQEKLDKAARAKAKKNN